MDDIRNGIGYSKSVEIQYEYLKQLGKTSDGFDNFLYFDKVPWMIKKTTLFKIEELSFWEKKEEDLKNDQKALAETFSGTFLESVNVNEKLIIGGKTYYAGSYTEASYEGLPSTLPPKLNLFEWSGGQVSPAGFFDTGSSSSIMFSSRSFSEIFYRSYTAQKPDEKVGIGGVTSVNKTNPRYINGKLYYDIAVQITTEGTLNV